MEAQCKGGVGADGVSSLIVVAGERRGLLGVGFENTVFETARGGMHQRDQERARLDTR